jgi:hypothetical protein
LLDQKVTKNQVQQKGFFAALRPLPCKSGKTWAAKLCSTSFPLCHRFSKYCYALAAAFGHHRFARFCPKLFC